MFHKIPPVEDFLVRNIFLTTHSKSFEIILKKCLLYINKMREQFARVEGLQTPSIKKAILLCL